MFGPHVDRIWASKSGGHRPSLKRHLSAARGHSKDIGIVASVFQVFIAGPRNCQMTLTGEEADELRLWLGDTGIIVVAHGTYIDAPWKGNKFAAKCIRDEIKMCRRAGISGLVIHLGAQRLDGIVTYMPHLVTDDSPHVKLYLELPSVLPENAFYSQPEDLRELFAALQGENVGLCIDTAHIWASGVDISTYDKAQDWLTRLASIEDVIPPSSIMVHLNDNFNGLGSGKDHHAPLGQGMIWSGIPTKQSGLYAFVEYIVKNNIPTVLERNSSESDKLASISSALVDDYMLLMKLMPMLTVRD